MDAQYEARKPLLFSEWLELLDADPDATLKHTWFEQQFTRWLFVGGANAFFCEQEFEAMAEPHFPTLWELCDNGDMTIAAFKDLAAQVRLSFLRLCDGAESLPTPCDDDTL